MQYTTATAPAEVFAAKHFIFYKVPRSVDALVYPQERTEHGADDYADDETQRVI